MGLFYFFLLPRIETVRRPGYESVAGNGIDDTCNASLPLLGTSPTLTQSFKANAARARHLFAPYMVPLALVYFAEYEINQGVSPTLLYPLEQTPFTSYRDIYPMYITLYQGEPPSSSSWQLTLAGVFLARSSRPFIKINNLYLPAILQVVNLVCLIGHAIFNFLPSIYYIFAMIFYEGVLGGLVYVSTYGKVYEVTAPNDREFALGAIGVSDSGGIVAAGLVALLLEPALCKYQISVGRPFCNIKFESRM